MPDYYSLLTSTLGEPRIKLDENLHYHLYSKANVTAQYFYIATSQKELLAVLNLCLELKIPFLVIGAGTKLIPVENFKGLVIKNRSSIIKISGIKGSIGKDGLGVKEALLEVDSGVSIGKMNEHLASQNLQTIDCYSSKQSTIGGSIFVDQILQEFASQIKVWEDGEVFEVDPISLKRNDQYVISIIIKVKSKNI